MQIIIICVKSRIDLQSAVTFTKFCFYLMLEQSGLVGVVMNEPIQKKVTLRRRAPEKVSSKQLLGETKKLFIQHAGSEYTLRITANNKLILTK